MNIYVAHDDHVERGIFYSTEFAKESMGVFRAEDQNLFPENTGLQRNTLEGFSSILDTVGALANQRQKLRASFFLIAKYAPDGETGGAATEAQILQRNEIRDIHMPRGALNTEGPKNQIPAHSRKRRAIRTGYLIQHDLPFGVGRFDGCIFLHRVLGMGGKCECQQDDSEKRYSFHFFLHD